MTDLRHTPLEELPATIAPLDWVAGNFQFFELYQSNTAARLGIDNRPTDPEIVKALVLHAREVLQPMREQFGPFRPNSVYRSPTVNEAVGGNPKSQHLVGEASDGEFPGIPNIELAEWIAGNLEFDQLILECYRLGEPSSGWVHVSRSFRGKNRGEILSYVWNEGSKRYQFRAGLIAAPAKQ